MNAPDEIFEINNPCDNYMYEKRMEKKSVSKLTIEVEGGSSEPILYYAKMGYCIVKTPCFEVNPTKITIKINH